MKTEYRLIDIDAATKITMDRIRTLERSKRLERLINVNTKIIDDNND